ncbi:DUF4249 domain-containing protein [Flavobacterium sediminis]|uniref:DUF4249 domain-containing protein n=1 Tax=Flavobacterium sediminis TaxID=2201181 RepID=A0A2U8QXS5_9FLAO|nr:DUF4249 family protein [Flavobacterium sediminis]AWM14706.1 DUF4249 domain-containing protein [Flavobacterium sediminis]
MVKIIYKIVSFFLPLLLILLSLISCEDVVNVDLDTAPPKLVVDASIKWQKGTSGNEQIIYLTTTGDYYTTDVPKVSGATVYITDENSNQFNFTENPGTGQYICGNFIPTIDGIYTLTVNYNGEIYTATETLKAVPTIDSVSQNDNGGFTGDEIELKFFFQDNGNEDNFYLIQFTGSFTSLPEYAVVDDEFFQGNQMFGLYINEDMQAGDDVTCTLQGISETYYNYMNILLSIAGDNSGSPFQTPPATVRGNLVNQTDFDNYALGFFRLSEIDTMNYIVE